MWQEEVAGQQMELRGEVRDPVKRETKYFSDWGQLKAILESNLTAEVYFRPQSKRASNR